MVKDNETCCHEGKGVRILFAIVLASALLACGLYFGLNSLAGPISHVNLGASPSSISYLISVNADADREVAPDKAELVFAVESRGQDATKIQEENDLAVAKVVSSIKALGVPEANIKTVGYSLDRWYEWSKAEEKSIDKGYILTNRVRVVTYDVNQAGGILKAAVANGANNVDSVAFGLSDRLRESVYNELLAQASEKAGAKAQSMAKASGVRIAKLGSMSEGYSYVQSTSNFNYRNEGYAKDSSAGSVPMPSSVSPGMAKLSASVSANYEIE